MAMRWSCWRRGCSWRSAAVGSPPPGRPGCAGPLETRAASDTRAQITVFHQRTPAMCCCSQTQSGEKYSDPFKLGWRDLKGLYEDIRKELHISTRELKDMSEYYFDGKGKAFRPIIVVLMARACNIHHNNSRLLDAPPGESNQQCLFQMSLGAGEMPEQLRALVASAEDPSLVLSTCMVSHSALLITSSVDLTPLLASADMQASQRSIALVAEMIHTATLVHDDVIDDASSRRGKHTVNKIWGEKKAVLAGDLILSAASVALARIGNTAVVSMLAQVIEDLVRGEFLQLGSKENENERFAHYLEKTFKKTASLIANSCKAVSVLACPDPVVHEIAYQYGKNVGIAFQLIDDVLDFTSCSDQMGKPTSADLKLGIATGPVLFACQQFPEMNAMIMRRFSLPGDVDKARQYVLQSDGVQQTTYLAQQYCHKAVEGDQEAQAIYRKRRPHSALRKCAHKR
ncbi:All trans-polyprenyl-diphosphate synthase PDSS1 [Apodemus speciosus]|uniref:All trans-polyprenyl-diphosphate synthase PDSS1 n=1 Tax=Apodemus speciosus TaxID=105296 RepID=A0ABQ0EGN7_APOSI